MEHSKILSAYKIDKSDIQHATVLASTVKEKYNEYLKLKNDLKAFITKRSDKKRKLEKYELKYTEGAGSPVMMEEAANEVEELTGEIANIRTDILRLSNELKILMAELQSVADPIAEKFEAAMCEAIRKRDEYLNIANSYDGELLRIGNTMNDIGIFQTLHIFRRKLPGGILYSSVDNLEAWKKNKYQDIDLDD